MLSCAGEPSFRNVLRLQPVHCVVVLHQGIVNLKRETFAACVWCSYAPRNDSLKRNTSAICVATFVRHKISLQNQSWTFEMCVVLHVARCKRNVSETRSLRKMCNISDTKARSIRKICSDFRSKHSISSQNVQNFRSNNFISLQNVQYLSSPKTWPAEGLYQSKASLAPPFPFPPPHIHEPSTSYST